jgi:hypothetical protein
MTPDPRKQGFDRDGWLVFEPDPAILDWVAEARPFSQAALRDPALAHWLDCDGTWFVGIDALANDALGQVGTAPLAGSAIDFITGHLGPIPPLHRAQVSVTWPGYPRPRRGESQAAARYRRNRDAAHVDGVLATGPERRRFVKEPHGFILGLPLTDADPGAAPLVVWQGSHHLMRAGFAAAFAGHEPATWPDIDVTEAYVTARRQVFQTCPRVPLPVRPGQAMLLHRLALHGIAPWTEGAEAGPDGRMIAYFRPDLPGGLADWLGPQP